MTELLDDHAAARARVSSDETDRDLVARFQAGDESAFDQIVELHERRVTRLVYRLLGWSHEVEDLVQDVFVSVLVNLHRFRGDSKFATWLTSVAVNRCRSHQRRKLLRFRGRAVLAERLRLRNAGQRPEVPDDHEEIRKAVRTLPATYREPIILRYYEALPQTEIAEVLGISVGAVEVRLSRARQRLRERLSAHLDNDKEPT